MCLSCIYPINFYVADPAGQVSHGRPCIWIFASVCGLVMGEQNIESSDLMAMFTTEQTPQARDLSACCRTRYVMI